jgi:hypothetical protein
VDTTHAGTYQVTYSYTDPLTNLTATATASVTVTAPVVAPVVQAKNSTITVGSSWTAQDNFVSAVDSEGNSVAFSAIKVTGTVDTSKAGTTTITYSYTDPITGLTGTATATITVTAAPSVAPTINVKNVTLTAGTAWDASQNLVSATDSEGKALTLSQLTTTNNVNNTIAGTYQVTYSYTDPATGLTGTATATVTVTAAPSTAQPKLTLTSGAMYNTQSALGVLKGMILMATNADGSQLTTAELASIKMSIVSGPSMTVLNLPGDYVIEFSYTDPSGQTVTATAPLHVVQDQTSLSVSGS